MDHVATSCDFLAGEGCAVARLALDAGVLRLLLGHRVGYSFPVVLHHFLVLFRVIFVLICVFPFPFGLFDLLCNRVRLFLTI